MYYIVIIQNIPIISHFTHYTNLNMSRYYDYDYDRNCIIGFGSDQDGLSNTLTKSQSLTNLSDATQLSPTSSTSGDSIYNISPYHMNINNQSPSQSRSQTPIATKSHSYTSSPSPSTSTSTAIAHEHQYYFGMTMDTECQSTSGLLEDDIIEYDPCDDEMYILEADTKDIKQQRLIPLKTEVPFLLVADMLKQEEILLEKVLHQSQIHKRQVENNANIQKSILANVGGTNPSPISLGFGDKINALNTDRNLWIQRGLNCIDGTIQHQQQQQPQIVQCEQIKRFDDYNGAFYNLFGTKIVTKNQCHVWRLQLLGNAPCIIGIIESSSKLQTRGGYFGCDTGKMLSYSFNTITAKTYSSISKSLQPIYQQMLQSGRLDKPMIIDMKLDLIHHKICLILKKAKRWNMENEQYMDLTDTATNSNLIYMKYENDKEIQNKFNLFLCDNDNNNLGFNLYEFDKIFYIHYLFIDKNYNDHNK